MGQSEEVAAIERARYRARLSESVPRLRDRINAAVLAAGRSPEDVRLVAVSKSHPLAAVEAALECGLTDLGENRVGELQAKAAATNRKDVRWHMIGHVQSRKAPMVVGLADLVHSVDSVRLAKRLSSAAVDEVVEMSILAQVNTSGEASKYGLDASSAVEAVHEMSELPGVRVEGLMTMAPFVDDEAVLREAFAALRELRNRVRAAADTVGAELSMGMTNDLESAIQEGSTMIRIGTALFGDRST